MRIMRDILLSLSLIATSLEAVLQYKFQEGMRHDYEIKVKFDVSLGNDEGQEQITYFGNFDLNQKIVGVFCDGSAILEQNFCIKQESLLPHEKLAECDRGPREVKRFYKIWPSGAMKRIDSEIAKVQESRTIRAGTPLLDLLERFILERVTYRPLYASDDALVWESEPCNEIGQLMNITDYCEATSIGDGAWLVMRESKGEAGIFRLPAGCLPLTFENLNFIEIGGFGCFEGWPLCAYSEGRVMGTFFPSNIESEGSAYQFDAEYVIEQGLFFED